VRKADNLPPSCAVVTKSRNLNFLEYSGLVQACNGTTFMNVLPIKCYEDPQGMKGIAVPHKKIRRSMAHGAQCHIYAYCVTVKMCEIICCIQISFWNSFT